MMQLRQQDQQLRLSVLFNDVVNCLGHTASVTDEYGTQMEQY